MVFCAQFQWIISLHYIFNVTYSKNVKAGMAFIQQSLLKIFKREKIPPKGFTLSSQELLSELYLLVYQCLHRLNFPYPADIYQLKVNNKNHRTRYANG